MRLRTWFAVWFVLAASPAGAADEQFPYSAYVNTDEVYVRSGPGKNYYPTEKLSRGDAVEIHRHDPGGWYAIRPPKGSFSWVSARYLRPNDDEPAIVEGDRVVCRVGTRFSDLRDVIQIRLDRGEAVEIIEAARSTDGGQPENWYKIAPPSGEFRWVFGKYVDREPAPGLSDGKPDEAVLQAETSQESDREVSDDLDMARDDRRHAEESRDPTGSIRLTGGDPEAEGGDRLPRKSGKDPAIPSSRDSVAENEKPSQRWNARVNSNSADGDTAEPAARDQRAGPSRKPRKPSAPADPLQSELDDIDLSLSAMVAEETTAWSFGDLRRRCESALDRSQTALERGKVRLVLNRIARFEDIKQRSDQVSQVRTDTDRRNAHLAAGGRGGDSVAIPTQAPEEASFDGVGKLTPVVSQRSGAPRFALVDGQNEVVSFITAAPGVNLQRYVGRQVGVSGQRGFMPELKKPHVMAMRVTPVDASPRAGSIRR